MNSTFVVIQYIDGFSILTYNDYTFSKRNDIIVYTGDYDSCQEFVNRSIAAQELVDSANREYKEETYTREEVYLVAQRSVHAVINNLLTDNRTQTIDQVINSEIDTVKLF